MLNVKRQTSTFSGFEVQSPRLKGKGQKFNILVLPLFYWLNIVINVVEMWLKYCLN